MNSRQMLAAVTLFIVGLFVSGTAKAASCDQIVGDDARLFGDGIGSVVVAANRLAAQGAFVRVRTTDSLGGATDLGPATTAMVANCASWRSGSQARSDLLLLVLYRDPATLKGKAQLYAGGQFQARVNAQWQGIKAQQIGPAFNAGNYVAAATGGLNGISSALGGVPVAPQPPRPAPVTPSVPTTQLNPQPSIPVTPAPAPAPTPVTPTVSTPTNSSGGSSTGLIVFVALLVLGGGGAAWYFISQSRANKKARQQDAKNAATSCATETEAFAPAKITVLEAKVNEAVKGCSTSDSTELSRLLAALKTGSSAALTKYGRLQQSGNPDDDGKSAAEYESMTHSYNAVLQDLAEAKATQTAIETKLGDIKRAAAQAKPALDQLGKDIETAMADIVNASGAGFNVTALESALEGAVTDQSSAETELGNGRAAAAKSLCDTGSAKAKKVSSDAKGLKARAQAIAARITSVKASITSTSEALVSAKADFDAISSTYADNCWDTVRGNGGKATAGLSSATQNCAAAETAAQMSNQDWEGAENFLGRAEATLREANSQLASITALKQNLETARANAPSKLQQARDDVRAAQTFITTNAADIEDVLEGNLLQQLRNAASTLPGQEALSASKPDYPAIIATAQAASKVAGMVLTKARSDKENTIAQRRLAVTAMETAVANISRATEYIQDHSRTVGSGYDVTIRSARDLLEAARRQGNNPAEQMRLAEQSAQAAADALSGAKSMVRSAQQTAQAQSDDAFLGGVVAGAVLTSVLTDNTRRGGGGLMGGSDDLSPPTPDFGGGGLMSGNDDIPSGGNPSNDDL